VTVPNRQQNVQDYEIVLIHRRIVKRLLAIPCDIHGVGVFSQPLR